MKGKQEKVSDPMIESAIGDVSVLSPSQRREQERLRKEKEAKEAADKEKRRIAAAKRKAAEEAAKAKRKREELFRKLPWIIGGSIFYGLVVGVICAFVLFFVAIIAELPLSILWWTVAVGGVAAIGFCINRL